MHQIQTLMGEMKELIVHKISHSYLRQYIQTPNIDEDKLLLIISMLETHGLTKLQMEDFVVTTMLIEIALDTHDRVSNSSKDSIEETNLKPRQLTVLAGTYYSSLYYKILADTSNLAMIRILAEGIKEVNEHKILFYQKDVDEIDKLMNSLLTIESAILKKVADYFHEGYWKEISAHFLFSKRLLTEKKLYLETGASNLFEALRKIVFPKSNALTLEQKNYLLIICDKYLDNSLKKVENGFKKIPYINEKLTEIWKRLSRATISHS